MRNELQAAIDRLEENVEYLEEVIDDQTTRSMVRDEALKDIPAFTVALSALRDALKRSEGCKWCIGKVNDKYATIPHAPMIHESGGWPVIGLDVPYRFCCNCGRDLAGATVSKKESDDRHRQGMEEEK